MILHSGLSLTHTAQRVGAHVLMLCHKVLACQTVSAGQTFAVGSLEHPQGETRCSETEPPSSNRVPLERRSLTELSDDLALLSRLQRSKKKIVTLGFIFLSPTSNLHIYGLTYSHTHLVTTGGVCWVCFSRLQTEDRQTGLLFERRKHRFY